MKRLFLIPFFSLAVMTMTACGGSSEETENPKSPLQPENPALPDDNHGNGGDDNKGDKKNDHEANKAMKVYVKVNSQTVTATMEDNAAAKDFLSRLPIEVTLNDFNNTTEKIFYPEPALNIDGVTRGCAPASGDITIYVPWGNVAIFCKSWSHSNDLIKIGHIDNEGIKMLSVDGDIKVRFESQND